MVIIFNMFCFLFTCVADTLRLVEEEPALLQIEYEVPAGLALGDDHERHDEPQEVAQDSGSHLIS